MVLALIHIHIDKLQFVAFLLVGFSILSCRGGTRVHDHTVPTEIVACMFSIYTVHVTQYGSTVYIGIAMVYPH